MDAQTETVAPEPFLLEGGFEWGIVEIFGHRRHAGRIREEERYGAKMMRVDVPKDETLAEWTTHFYGGAAIFSYTLTDEATVRLTNKHYSPAARYRLPPPDDEEPPHDPPHEDGDEDGIPF